MGLAYGAIPVGWSTWMARSVPDEAKSGGGLIVAAVQLAITLGAAGGGAIDALAGVAGVFVSGDVLMLVTSVIIFGRFAAKPPSWSTAKNLLEIRVTATKGLPNDAVGTFHRRTGSCEVRHARRKQGAHADDGHLPRQTSSKKPV